MVGNLEVGKGESWLDIRHKFSQNGGNHGVVNGSTFCLSNDALRGGYGLPRGLDPFLVPALLDAENLYGRTLLEDNLPLLLVQYVMQEGKLPVHRMFAYLCLDYPRLGVGSH